MNKFFTKKRVIWLGIIIVLGGGIAFFVMGKKGSADNVQTELVKRQNLTQTVLSTGQVVSTTDLALSFQGNGVVKQVAVKEGDKVRAGQMLARLDLKNALASLTSAQGALDQAQANYAKVVAGAAGQDVAVTQEAVNIAQVSLDNARTSLEKIKTTQEQAVENARIQLLGLPVTIVPNQSNLSTIVPTVTGTYSGIEAGIYTLRLENSPSILYSVIGLESIFGVAGSRTTPTAFGSRGLRVQFSTTGNWYPGDTWTVEVPNTSYSTYSTYLGQYRAAQTTQAQTVQAAEAQVAAAEQTLAQAKAQLILKQAPARSFEVDSAKAQVTSARGQVAAAQAAVEDGTLRAPSDGTITLVDIKVGELATTQKQVMVLQDVAKLHIEANISEANIASLRSGQSVDVTFDALSPDKIFKATVQTINPASTVVSGVVNYKVVASIGTVAEIKPGMTANMTILVAQKENALSVPSAALLNRGGKQFVRLVNNSKTKTYNQIEIQTGMQADGGLVEVVSGLSEGESVVTYIK